MRNRLAPIGAWQTTEAAQTACDRSPAGPGPDVNRRARHQPCPEGKPDRSKCAAPCLHRPGENAHGQRQNHRAPQSAQHPARLAALPRHHRAERQQQAKHDHERRERHVEERRTDRDLALARRGKFDHQRPDCSDEDDEGRDGQQHVIGHQHGFTAVDRKDAAGLHHPGPGGKKREAAQHENREYAQKKHTALGVVGKGMHGGQDPRSGDEGTDHGKAERNYGQKHGPAFQAFSFLDHDGRMQQRRRDEPGHEGRVLHRIPEPEPAPAKLVIGPPAAKADADRQEDPCGKGVRPHPTTPGRIDTSLDQRRDGKAEGHRKAHVTEIEKRRVKREPRILQQGVEILPVEGGHRQPLERVRGKYDEGEKGHADHRLHTQDTRPQSGWKIAAEPCRHRTEKRHDQHPQQHRSLMVTPCAGDLVEHRLGGMAVEGDQPQREIRRDEGPHQRPECKRRQQELCGGGRISRCHPARPSFLCPNKRNHRLETGDQKGEDQREVPEFCNHAPSIERERACANEETGPGRITLSRGRPVCANLPAPDSRPAR